MPAAAHAASAALWLGALGAVLGGLAGALAGRVARRLARRPSPAAGAAQRQAQSLLRQARRSADAVRGQAELAVREEALARREAFAHEAQAQEARLARLKGGLAAREEACEQAAVELDRARQRLDAGTRPLAERRGEEDRHRQAAAAALAETRARLEGTVGEPAQRLRAALVRAEVEVAQAEAAQRLRQAEAESPAEVGRRAARLLGIAAGRISGHHLTERGQTLVVLGLPVEGQPAVTAGELLAIEAAAGVKLALTEAGDVVRIEGLDGVGREIARRSLLRLLAGEVGGGATSVGRAAWQVAADLEREVAALGDRAFDQLGLPRAHPEIVRLVGRLAFRTSFTQNQWQHAVEVAFLCGLLADELKLDRALARRAALLHDIGKALTHELDGAHAVIGAEQARRFGELEVVANAVGAHHGDEPFGSLYAPLVAAADALSGGRPGARRHTEDNYLARIADLERIARGFPGVAEVFALHGGRELRVLVREQEVDDLAAVQLSSAIAQAISERLSFPGQIRVTVIRELRAVATTGV
jgi:ribonuclease Y